MGLHEYAAMQRHWADHPPVALMVAAYLGIKPRAKTDSRAGDMGELAALFGAKQGQRAVIR